ncbi:MAG: putative DNA binding domain-containing protein [Verrucomicrobia bacterium]|nr:putative DNA binding domain-containing protein [Verrucomicrobiota bacterium]
MDKDEILEFLKCGEHINMECKKAESFLPKSIWETYSSFANTDGGMILLGVEENLKEIDFTKRFSFTSVKNPKQRIKEFWDIVNNRNKVSCNLLVDSDVGICEVGGATVLWIRVPRASYKQRPVYINENPYNGTYKRNYEGDYHCSEDDVKAMIRDANESGNDGALLDGYTLDDIDMDSLKSYRIEFELRNPGHLWNSKDDLEFLKEMGCYTTDRISKKEGVTTAGLLMFGKGKSIRERFDNIRMDYLDQTNLLPGSRWSDRLTDDGNWENNLYNFVKQIIPKLVSNLKRPFRMEGMVRIDDTPVHKAIREATINMVIHSDYMIRGTLKVIKNDKGFIFSNPGSLMLPVQKIYEGGHTAARNPKIQTLFRMIGYGDNIGSGVPTILNAWKEENWRRPDLCQDDDLHEVELKLWMISLMPEECTRYLQKLFGLAYTHLDNNSQIILGTAYLEKGVTNARMQSVLELHSTEISHILAALVEKKMLVADNKRRWTTYQLNTVYEKQPEQMNLTDGWSENETKLNNTDRIIYEYVQVNGGITRDKVIEITPKIRTRGGASIALNRLLKAGLITQERQGKYVKYKLKHKSKDLS